MQYFLYDSFKSLQGIGVSFAAFLIVAILDNLSSMSQLILIRPTFFSLCSSPGSSLMLAISALCSTYHLLTIKIASLLLLHITFVAKICVAFDLRPLGLI